MAGKYIRGIELGKGAYGQVYKAYRKSDGEDFALKRMLTADPRHGANPSALREIKALQALHHKNVICMYDVYSADEHIHMVLEICPLDLDTVIKHRTIFLKEQDIRSYFRMTLEGLQYCHNNFVLHRDLKPENLLIGRDGVIRLGDFGLAKSFPTSGKMTSAVATIWYRAPELLFGAEKYSAAVDVWGAGCIFAEMMLRVPLFQTTEESEIQQLQRIFNVLGTPSTENWPDVEALPQYVIFDKRDPLKLRDLIVEQYRQPETAYELLSSLLMLDPKRRVSCGDALNSSFFAPGNASTPPAELPHGQLMKMAKANVSQQMPGAMERGMSSGTTARPRRPALASSAPSAAVNEVKEKEPDEERASPDRKRSRRN